MQGLLEKLGYESAPRIEIREGRAHVSGLDGPTLAMLRGFGMELKGGADPLLIDLPLHSPKPFNLTRHLDEVERNIHAAEREGSVKLLTRIGRHFYDRPFQGLVRAEAAEGNFREYFKLALAAGQGP